VKVSQKEISTKEMKNGGAITTIPYGMAVWSTGIGTRPFIRDFMSQIGQVCLWEICHYIVLIQYSKSCFSCSLYLFFSKSILHSFIIYST